MTRRRWRVAAGFLAGFGSTAVVAVLALAFLGPKPGAPEGARTLGVGPLWLSRLESSEPRPGRHELRTVTNAPAFLTACIAAGVVCAILASYRGAERGGRDDAT